MVTNIIAGASLLVTLLGAMGIREKRVKRRMLALSFATVGNIGLAFAQTGEYGLICGFQQVLFRGFGLILFLLLMSSVCKKNEIVMLEELNGIRRFMPYTYALLALLAMILIGIPGTGTFTSVMYVQIGYMFVEKGVISYIGMIGNVVGMMLTASIVFPMLREAFLFEKKEIVNGKSVATEPAKKREFVAVGKLLMVIEVLAVAALLLLGVWQDVMTTIVVKLVDMIK